MPRVNFDNKKFDNNRRFNCSKRIGNIFGFLFKKAGGPTSVIKSSFFRNITKWGRNLTEPIKIRYSRLRNSFQDLWVFPSYLVCHFKQNWTNNLNSAIWTCHSFLNSTYLSRMSKEQVIYILKNVHYAMWKINYLHYKLYNFNIRLTKLDIVELYHDAFFFSFW